MGFLAHTTRKAETIHVGAAAFVFVVTLYTSYLTFHVDAAQIQTLSDTLSTSKPGIGADHTIRFVSASDVPEGSTVVVTLPSGFDTSTITEDDVDVIDDGVDLTTNVVCGAAQAAVTVLGQEVRIEVCVGGGGAIASSSQVRIEIGHHATSSGVGTHRIVNNPIPGSYELGIAGTAPDQGYTRLVIIDAVTASGEVETYFSFSVGGVGAGQTVNEDVTLTFSTTTATTVPFGVVQPNTEYLLGQDLFVTTNADAGFTVTVAAADDLRASSNATINSFIDGSGTSTPSEWVAPAGVSGSLDTYGHWGVTTDDATLSDDDSFGNARYAGDFITTPREVMNATSSADGTAPGIGRVRVGYKLETSMMQEAANDYETTLTYVATPTF